MDCRKAIVGILFLASISFARAQSVQDVEELQHSYQACLEAKSDTSACGKRYLRQTDSIMDVLFGKVRLQLSSKEKVDFQNEQKNWQVKQAEYNKKQDENFSYNLKEGTWKPNMIWLVYENKAEFIRKRALTLAKRLKE